MPYYTFGRNDILYNRIEANPHYEFVLYTGSVYLNNFSGALENIPNGNVSLTEMNVSRSAALHTYDSADGTGVKSLIFPYFVKGGSLDAFGTTTKSDFMFSQYGSELTASYTAQTASLARLFVAEGSGATNRPRITALRTTFERYTHMSKKYEYSNFETAKSSLICVPSIFFGSAIKKRSVRLKYYITGTLAAELHDVYGNGELIQVSGSSVGSCEGVVLYKEGFIVLTGSTSVTSTATAQDNFNICKVLTDGVTTAADNTFKWVYWGEMGLTSSHPMGACSTESIGSVVSSSYSLEFKGTTKIPVLTMFAHAPKGELNFTSNPTFVAKGTDANPRKPASPSTVTPSGSKEYIEKQKLLPANTISSSYAHHSASLEKQTFISYIKIYDEHHECIAIAKLARPIKKQEEKGYTFKLKLDI